MYAWEHSFAKLVELARKSEIGVITKTSYYKSFNFSFFIVSSKLILVAILIPYVLTGDYKRLLFGQLFQYFYFPGEPMTADRIFLTMALYDRVRLSMTLFFPNAISMGSEAAVSFKRIRV